jgi:hypothetical protein
MTRSGDHDLDRDQKRAREMIRGLPTPKADATFRDRLKRGFVDGTISTPARPEREASWFPKPVVISIALSAAAVIFLLFLSVANRGPSWELLRPESGAELRVDGEPIDLDRLEAAQDRLRPGATIEVEGSADITLSCAGHILFQLPPGSEIRLPSQPKRWLGRDLQTELTRGRLRIVTGEDFAGARLTVRTPDASVEVLGTTLAVILEDYGTCVCVMHGTVRAATADYTAETIPEGMRKVFYNDGRPPETDSMRPDERMKLEGMRVL